VPAWRYSSPFSPRSASSSSGPSHCGSASAPSARNTRENFAAYSFVLSGYTVVIAGIPGALDADYAFYIATGRVTEVCQGIIVAATVNHIILPSSLGPQLWQAVIGARQALADYALALFERRGDSAPSRTKLLGQAITIKNLRASAIFEDREIRDRSDRLWFLDAALIDAISVAQPARRSGATRVQRNGARRCHCRCDCCDQGMARRRNGRARPQPTPAAGAGSLASRVAAVP
jgi:hypothetical protein